MVDQEQLREKQMSMFDDLLDLKCDLDGIRTVIGEMLYFYEFTKEELLAMNLKTTLTRLSNPIMSRVKN